MQQFLRLTIDAIQPLFTPICFVLAWGLILLIAWVILGAIANTYKQARTMHQIPCANCHFFTGNYFLKCPVQPRIALSENAIDCPDYDPVSSD